MKRLFIERDSKFDGSRVNSYLKDLGYNPYTFFDTIQCDARDDVKATWDLIVQHNEIYAETSIVDIGFMGSGTMFNTMMFRAIEERVEGKNLYLFSDYEGIYWSNLRANLVDGAFRKNYLYVMSENWPGWEQVDIDKLIKEKL